MSSTIRIFDTNEIVSNIAFDAVQDTSKEICMTLTMVGAYEEMLTWRKKYLDWLHIVSLSGNYRIALNQYSRTWNLSFFFEDVRDAILFKLTWA